MPMAMLFQSPVDDPVAWADALTRLEPGLEVRVWPEVGRADDVEAALVWKPPAGLLASLPNLKLIQSLGAGIDHILADPELPGGVPVCRLVDDALTRQMVEYVTLAVLHHHRRMAEYQAFQARAEWRQLPPLETRHRRVGVMGLGVIGSAVAERLAAFDFRLAGWSRTAKALPNVAGFHGTDGLGAFLAATDVLVCLLPLTPETESILDAGLFAALPEGAYVINAARGGHLVEADLLAALDSGHLSGAWLDVCRDEPLPADSPLWRHPRITLTPHIAGWVLPETASALVIDNLRRVRAGAAPRHAVAGPRGY
jgi:glyoxylate/hydroxypyruvate reductase A